MVAVSFFMAFLQIYLVIYFFTDIFDYLLFYRYN
ncbi:hypothetical protein GGE08_003241 [Muricauda sp. ARW1Y1]|nr:hypothetical protein [Muricauda sp. ARW1Y1]